MEEAAGPASPTARSSPAFRPGSLTSDPASGVERLPMIQNDAPVLRTFGRYPPIVELPNLVEIQTKAWEAFLASAVPQGNRENQGLEVLLGEVFPIYSYDKTMCLEYVGYELGRPRYTIDECRKLRLTYGYPFKVRLRLIKPEPVEEEVYL